MPRATDDDTTKGGGMLPPMPPKTEAEKVLDAITLAMLRQVGDQLEQRNLDNAVRLAQQAAARRGPLVAHFAEIGRRFSFALQRDPEAARDAFQVIEGGAA